MKHYMDIEALRETDEKIGELFRKSNTSEFQVGDHIQITEKYDGSNGSIENVNGEILAYSRKNQTTFSFTLNGFFNYIQARVVKGLTIPEGIVVFGEWSGAKNKLIYEKKDEWFVFDVYERATETYWSQERVKAFCEEKGLVYIHELYNGPFISWEHCKSFLHSPYYGEKQEGVVVKNQDKLTSASDYYYLKIVNADFKERNARKPKPDNAEKREAEAEAKTVMQTIVTRPRVEKMLYKLRDEGIIGTELTPKDLGIIAKNLPKRIYEDCVKEEKETIIAAGEFAGKLCATLSMEIARKIILG